MAAAFAAGRPVTPFSTIGWIVDVRVLRREY